VFAKRVLIWSVVACFAVFFGVDLATRGIQDVHGPVTRAETGAASSGSFVPRQSGAAEEAGRVTPETRFDARIPGTSADGRQTIPQQPAAEPGTDGRSEEAAHPVNLYPYIYESGRNDTLVNKMADTTGSLVRRTANRGVAAFVSLFDAIVGTR